MSVIMSPGEPDIILKVRSLMTCRALLLGRNKLLGKTVLTWKYLGTKADNAFLRVLSNQIQACVEPSVLRRWSLHWMTIIKSGFFVQKRVKVRILCSIMGFILWGIVVPRNPSRLLFLKSNLCLSSQENQAPHTARDAQGQLTPTSQNPGGD